MVAERKQEAVLKTIVTKMASLGQDGWWVELRHKALTIK
jgi:hypothetical protein